MHKFVPSLIVSTALLSLAIAGAAVAAPVAYEIDSTHTHPSFVADHMGLSLWRGKFNRSTGTVTLDKAAGTGSVNIVVDTASVDFGLDALNKVARGSQLFEVEKYPQAAYQGKLADFVNGAPTRVIGKLTLHGVTRPVVLTIRSFKCIPDPLLKPRERCGADAVATIRRDAFGMDAGKDYGFKMTVKLYIQVEAVESK